MAEAFNRVEVMVKAGTRSPFQLLLHEVTGEWGIPLTEKKSVTRALTMLARGAKLHGVRGAVAPTGDKAAK